MAANASETCRSTLPNHEARVDDCVLHAGNCRYRTWSLPVWATVQLPLPRFCNLLSKLHLPVRVSPSGLDQLGRDPRDGIQGLMKRKLREKVPTEP